MLPSNPAVSGWEPGMNPGSAHHSTHSCTWRRCQIRRLPVHIAVNVSYTSLFHFIYCYLWTARSMEWAWKYEYCMTLHQRIANWFLKKIPQMTHLWADNETSAINTAACTNVHLVKATAAEGAQLWASINPITKHLPGELMWPHESNRSQWKAVALRFCQSHKIPISTPRISSSRFPLKNADGLQRSSEILLTKVAFCYNGHCGHEQLSEFES